MAAQVRPGHKKVLLVLPDDAVEIIDSRRGERNRSEWVAKVILAQRPTRPTTVEPILKSHQKPK